MVREAAENGQRPKRLKPVLKMLDKNCMNV